MMPALFIFKTQKFPFLTRSELISAGAHNTVKSQLTTIKRLLPKTGNAELAKG